MDIETYRNLSEVERMRLGLSTLAAIARTQHAFESGDGVHSGQPSDLMLDSFKEAIEKQPRRLFDTFKSRKLNSTLAGLYWLRTHRRLKQGGSVQGSRSRKQDLPVLLIEMQHLQEQNDRLAKLMVSMMELNSLEITVKPVTEQDSRSAAADELSSKLS